MFENVGNKIRMLAKVICVLGIIGSVIAGISMIAGGSQISYYSNSNVLILPGLLVMILGSVVSWANALLLYTFGEMAENIAALRKAVDQQLKP